MIGWINFIAYSLFVLWVLVEIQLIFGLTSLPWYIQIFYYGGLHFGILVLSFFALRGIWLQFLFSPPKITRLKADFTPEMFKIPYEKVELKSSDGVILRGWFIPSRKENHKQLSQKGTIIVCHGITSSRYFQLPRSIFLHTLGYNILLMDLRAHGDSDGKYVTFGFKEQFDIEASVQYIKNRKDIYNKKIALVAHSMGGATGILYTAVHSDIQALIVLSCYSSIEEDMNYWIMRIARLPKYPFVYFGKKLFQDGVGVALDTIDPINYINEVKIPVFFIHGKEDEVSHYSSSERLYAKANAPKELWIVDGAAHETIYETAGREFERRIRDFLHKYFD
jgi:alpha-beta hydrolase superfamily lysophospholipase